VKPRLSRIDLDVTLAGESSLKLGGDIKVVTDLMRGFVIRLERQHKIKKRSSAIGRIPRYSFCSARASKQRGPESVLKQHGEIEL